MAKGIIYLMTTVVSGLIKIGKTGNDQFENRMRFLESNGYANITGLKREFAIEVDGYDEKEKLIHDIFSKTRARHDWPPGRQPPCSKSPPFSADIASRANNRHKPTHGPPAPKRYFDCPWSHCRSGYLSQ